MTGWTWDDVEDTLTLPRLHALLRHWKRYPPLPRLIAEYLGVRPPEHGTHEELLQAIAATRRG